MHARIKFDRFSIDYAIYKEKFARAKCLEELEMFGAKLLHLLGIILLLINKKFVGNVRERIFVAFYRMRFAFLNRKHFC